MSFYELKNSKSKEHLYVAANIAESYWMLGTECTLVPVKSTYRDLSGDPHNTYAESYVINIMFEDNPRAKLKALNWVAEGEDLPYLAYISQINYPKYLEWKTSLRNPDLSPEEKALLLNDYSSFVITIEQFSLVEVPYEMQVNGSQVFEITNLQGDTINPLVWTCKLVPSRVQRRPDLGMDPYIEFNMIDHPTEEPFAELVEPSLDSDLNYHYLNPGDA